MSLERMRLIDLERHSLRTAFRGYDRAQVDALIQKLTAEVGSMANEVRMAREEMERTKGDLERVRSQENTIKDALIAAQKSAEETRAASLAESEQILERARRDAEALLQQQQAKINDLRWEMERLRLEKQRFINEFRAMLEAHLRELNENGGLALVEIESSAG